MIAQRKNPFQMVLLAAIGAARCWTWIFTTLVVLCSLPGIQITARADSPGFKQHQIKAAFVYNFMKFVEWPSNRVQDAATPLVIGVVGKGPMRAELENAVKNRKVNGRDIVVRPVENADAAKLAHLLFVTSSEDDRLGELMVPLASCPVLTVGESEAFAKSDGMITFLLEGDKVRFDINIDPAEKAGLKVSSLEVPDADHMSVVVSTFPAIMDFFDKNAKADVK